MKRFYKLVSTHDEPGGYSIRLDGRPVKTPGGTVLTAPTQGLADALVLEWAAQDKLILPETMPLTQYLSTRMDRVGQMRAEISRLTLNYLDTDLLCYRAENPPGIPEQQAKSWDPVLKWFEEKFGAALLTTTALHALKQPAAAHAAAKAYVENLDDDRFTILQFLTAASGSLIMAIAFLEGALDAKGIFDASHIEEKFMASLYNEALHGPDPAQEKKDISLRRDYAAAEEYLRHLKKI